MSNRTFVCLACKTLQRRPASRAVVTCPRCNASCICVHWKLHVPAPRKKRKWEKFWKQYLLELRQIEEFKANPHAPTMYLPLLNQRWLGRSDRIRLRVAVQ